MDATTFRATHDASGRWSGRRLRLSTLVRLRWLAVLGQTLAILVVGLWFKFPLPVGACFALIALSAWLNLGLRVVFPSRTASIRCGRRCCSPTTFSSSPGCFT
jgi:hypothetical protein